MSFLRFLVYGNILVSLAVGFLTFGISNFLGFSDAISYSTCTAFATLMIYNLQRLLRFEDVKQEYSVRHLWIVKHKVLLIILSLIGGAGALLMYLMIGVSNDIYIVISFTLIGFLYAYKGVSKHALRDLPFLKIYLIAFVWTGVSVLWPVFRDGTYSSTSIFIALSVFLYILAATIPFDIRDLIYDDAKKKTIPQQVGVMGSKLIGSFLLIVSVTLLFFIDPNFLFNPFLYLSYIGLLLLILLTKKERKEMYFSGLIDGWIIFLGLMFAYQAFL
tara:strand:- start:53347 stop:54168 length:822 start_codon:yes stop_codon:yes gene_type:complete